MKCPYCGYKESKVVDSRPAEEGSSIRRRRECLSCEKRFTTYETVESLPMVVIKKDGSRQSFDRSKVLRGMIRACEKRPVSFDELERISEEIEQNLQNSLEREVSTEAIGEQVMDKLRSVDEVAYVRFASVYRRLRAAPNRLAESRNAALKNILDRNFLHLVEQPQLREQLGGVGAELCAVLAFGEAVRNGEKRLRRVQLRVLDHDVKVGLPRVPGGVHRAKRFARPLPVLRLGGSKSGFHARAPAVHTF